VREILKYAHPAFSLSFGVATDEPIARETGNARQYILNFLAQAIDFSQKNRWVNRVNLFIASVEE
jgi:hypothetical protein